MKESCLFRESLGLLGDGVQKARLDVTHTFFQTQDIPVRS